MSKTGAALAHAGSTALRFGYYAVSRVLLGLSLGAGLSLAATLALLPLWWRLSELSWVGRASIVCVQVVLLALPWIWALWSYRHGLLLGASKAIALQQKPLFDWLLGPLREAGAGQSAIQLGDRFCQLDACLPRAQRVLSSLIVAQLDRSALHAKLLAAGTEIPAITALGGALAEQIEERWLQPDCGWMFWLAGAHAALAFGAVYGLHWWLGS